MNNLNHAVNVTMKSTTAQRARTIANTLGTRSAAGYLRNRCIPLDSALLILGFGAERCYWLRHAPAPHTR